MESVILATAMTAMLVRRNKPNSFHGCLKIMITCVLPFKNTTNTGNHLRLPHANAPFLRIVIVESTPGVALAKTQFRAPAKPPGPSRAAMNPRLPPPGEGSSSASFGIQFNLVKSTAAPPDRHRLGSVPACGHHPVPCRHDGCAGHHLRPAPDPQGVPVRQRFAAHSPGKTGRRAFIQRPGTRMRFGPFQRNPCHVALHNEPRR